MDDHVLFQLVFLAAWVLVWLIAGHPAMARQEPRRCWETEAG